MSIRYTLWILAPVLAISGLLLILGGAAAWYVHRLNKDVSDVLHEHVVGMVASERLVLAITDIGVELNRFVNMGERQHLVAARAAAEENRVYYEQLRAQAAREPAASRIEATFRAQERVNTELKSLLQQEPPRQETARDLARYVAAELLQPARDVLEYNRQVAQRESDRNKMLADRIGLGLLLLGTCGALAGLLSGYSIARGVTKSLVQLSVPIRDTAGKLSEVVGPIRITGQAGFPELKAMLSTIADETTAVVQRLQATQRDAVRAEQLAAVGQLAAGLAHELRNPLMSMKILVQASAEKGSANPGLIGRDLRVLEEEIVRLEHLIQSFLDFARPPRPAKRKLDLCDVAEQTQRLVVGRGAQQDVELRLQLPAAPIWIEADAAQLRQVILNLLLNALDANPGGGIVEIRLEQTGPHAAGKARLAIRDSGPGLPAELGERIFEPFVSTKETGLGLGLSICRRIIDDHGGTITARNAAQGGAEFLVELPLQPSDSVPAPSPMVAKQN